MSELSTREGLSLFFPDFKLFLPDEPDELFEGNSNAIIAVKDREFCRRGNT